MTACVVGFSVWDCHKITNIVLPLVFTHYASYICQSLSIPPLRVSIITRPTLSTSVAVLMTQWLDDDACCSSN